MLFSSNAGNAPARTLPWSGKDEPAKGVEPLRIIVADDDRDTVLTLMMLLREEGHDVRGVHSGRLVMGVVLDFNPNVVILDIHLPGLSGWEVARTIRSRRGRTQPLLIGVSGEYKKSTDRILSEILGFDHYLLKPYDPNALLALLPNPDASPPDR